MSDTDVKGNSGTFINIDEILRTITSSTVLNKHNWWERELELSVKGQSNVQIKKIWSVTPIL